ncbi:hypothetical protein ACNHUS_05435 [Actinomycetes bacterium M1A6_2h]
MFAALLGASLGRRGGGWTAYVAGSSFAGDLSGPWASQATVAAVGAVVGLFVGAALYAAGMRMVGPQGNRIVRVVVAGVAGVLVGLSPTLVYVGSAFVGLPANVSVAVPVDSILVLYAISAVLGYGCSVGAVWLMLRASADSFTAQTTRAAAVAVPVGGIAATLAGVGVAWFLGFTTAVSTFVAVVATVVLVLAATFALARSRVIAPEAGR